MPYGTHKTQAAMNKEMLIDQWHRMKAEALIIGRVDLIEKYPLPDGGLRRIDKVTAALYHDLEAAKQEQHQ